MNEITVEAINRAKGIAILSTGERCGVDHFLDSEGDECGSEQAVVAIIGPDMQGAWYAADLRDFEDVWSH